MAVARAYRKSPEDVIHESVVDYLERVVAAGACFVRHPANEGKRTLWEQGRFKARGGKAGVFDLVLVLIGGRHAYVEVKDAGKDLTADQEAFAATLDRCGTPWAVVRSLDDLRAFLARIGVPTREAVP